MKTNFILLTVIGTLLPNIFVVRETLESGNFLLYRDPVATFNGMFANNISSAFAIDLLFVLVLFLVWSYHESLKMKFKGYWWIWIYTFGLGIAGGLPLFLFYREKYSQK